MSRGLQVTVPTGPGWPRLGRQPKEQSLSPLDGRSPSQRWMHLFEGVGLLIAGQPDSVRRRLLRSVLFVLPLDYGLRLQ